MTNILLGLILLDLIFITIMVWAIGEKVNEKEKD
jgi:hypothetical protein|tara:strand:+ start:637 stop:738 length:102 start_codon:yes stop_codon:yes gene_type:complete